MEKKLLNSPKSEQIAYFSLMAEMVLDKAILDFRKKNIEEKIDKALNDKNKEEFLRLTEELKKIAQ